MFPMTIKLGVWYQHASAYRYFQEMDPRLLVEPWADVSQAQLLTLEDLEASGSVPSTYMGLCKIRGSCLVPPRAGIMIAWGYMVGPLVSETHTSKGLYTWLDLGAL